ncbi:MAG: TIGR00266 family protein [Candidatus Nanoarchaeia archaeon]
MEYKVRGTTMQVVDVQLQQGETVYTEAGGMGWMSPNIKMETNSKGGFMKGLGRMFSGESFFMNLYTCTEGTGLITFPCEMPGKVVPMKLTEGEAIIAQRDAFMFAENSVKLEMHFRKNLGTGFFGGEGFIMQKISGPGQAFFEFGGEITEYNLQEGQVLKIDPGYIGCYEEKVSFELTTVGGVKNKLFGGEGFFLATVKGPGKVWLQSLPLARLAQKLIPYLPKKKN